jgi:peroxiredoxin
MDSLTSELNAFMNSLMDRVDPQVAAAIRDSQANLAQSGMVGRAIGVGDHAPDFTLLDQDENAFSLSAALARGPAVVLFIRGGWCPFCAITLRSYNKARALLAREGASLVAISPGTIQNIQTTAERDGVRYPVLSDRDLRVATDYGLVWELGVDMQKFYTKLGHDLPRINGNGDWRLPIPAGYVIGQDGIVSAARVSTQLTVRMLPAEALEAVHALERSTAG